MTQEKSVSGTGARRVASSLPNVSVELLEFSRFENTLTLKLQFMNAGEKGQSGHPGYGSYLLDEKTGEKYKNTVYSWQGSNVIIPADGSLYYWVKFTLPDGEWPKHLTAVLNGVLLEHLEVPQ